MWIIKVSWCIVANVSPPSHIWLFEGAEGGKWLSDFEAAQAQVALPFSPATNAPLPSPSTPMTSVDAQRDTKRARVL
jgi:hypothetical protein